MAKPKRDIRFFEEWAARNKMVPIVKVLDPDGDILIADSKELVREGRRMFYRTGYAINREGLEIGNYHDYGLLDFANYTPGGALEKRVNEALEHARWTLAATKQAGLYDAGGRQSFHPQRH